MGAHIWKKAEADETALYNIILDALIILAVYLLFFA